MSTEFEKLRVALRAEVRRAAFEVRGVVVTYPRLYDLLRLLYDNWARYKALRNGSIDPQEAVVQPDTEIVIDGYQGSANSFATVAFKYAQQRPVRIAHHLHAPVSVIRAVEMRIPTVVTIRDPQEAALSLIRRWPHITAVQALRWYIRFYKTLLPYVSELVVSPFSYTTRRLDEVFGEVNARYGTSFELFVHTPDNVSAVRGSQTNAQPQSVVDIKEKKSREFDSPKAQALLGRASVIYTEFLKAGGKPLESSVGVSGHR